MKRRMRFRRLAASWLLSLTLFWSVDAGHLLLSAAEEAATGEIGDDNGGPSSAEPSSEQAGQATAAQVSTEAATQTPTGNFTAPAQEDAAPADDQTVKPGALGMQEPVSLDLRNIEVADALRFLSQKAGMNLIISKNVSGRVQLLLNNVPIQDILDLLMITNGLAYEKYGEVYNIMTETEFKERFGRKFSDSRKVKLFKLKYTIPEQAFSTFEVLKSELGRLLVDPESGTVLVMDTEENIKRMENALDALEQRKAVKVYQLKYAKALDVETRLKARLDSKKVGTAAADERTNSVIVETLPDRIQEIDEIVKSLDQKTREVLIDAKIVKVTMSNNLDAEIKWEGMFNQLTKYGASYLGNHPFAPLARTGTSFLDDFVRITPTTTPTQGVKNTLTENLFLGTVGEDAFEVMINFLRQIGHTKILSNPKIAVVNNQEAKIHVGEKQAYVTTTTTTGQTTTTTAESVTFVDVGIQLAVTPTINDDGFVSMKIKPEISSVTSFLTTPSGNRIPIIDSSLAETSVMVKDGVSIIIGGLRRDEKTEDRKKVPVLGDIPVLGAPFNSFTNTNVHTELLIVITPHVIYGDTLVDGSGRKASDRPFLSYTDYTGIVDIKKDPVKGAPGVRG